MNRAARPGGPAIGSALLLLAAVACGGAPDPGIASPSLAIGPTTDGPWFTEQASASGLDFVHTSGASGRRYYPEILPPGVALFDFDGDGDLDVYLPQGHGLGAAPGTAASATTPDGSMGGRLYRNDLAVGVDGVRRLHFTDVTVGSGLVAPEFGLGVATGDVDNDGDVDLYVTGFERSRLFLSDGHGHFADATAASGATNAGGLAVSAAFVDIDRDGWLDLYVANNVVYRTDDRTVCPNPAGAPDYCPPQIYGGQRDRLYRNLGNGHFRDVTATALPGLTARPGLGVATADFDGDGWIDIVVANDGEPDFLWLNQHDGTFRERGLTAGIALTGEGRAEASMGVDAGDVDDDGDEDVVVTELTGQGTNLFVNDGRAGFRDVSAASGLGGASQPYTGWGTAWLDYDNDGWLDLLSVNGTIVAQEARAGRTFPYDQVKLLFRNLGTGRFETVTTRAGPALALSTSGRGAAFGDIDNDGDTDVLVGNNSGPVHLLINEVGARQHWIGLRLTSGAGRDLLGARVAVARAGQPTRWRRARADGSYGSANDPRVLVGLGMSAVVPALRVRWPDGREERWAAVPVDAYTTLRQGDAR